MAKLKVPILLTLAIGAIVYLVVTGIRRNDIYMSTLDQWDPGRARRETVRLMGFVKEGTIAEEAGSLVTRFELRNDKGSEAVPVRFQGVTPELFRSGAAVVASGTLAPDGTFVATDLMTKCPSKYEGVDMPPDHPRPDLRSAVQ